MKLSPDSVGRYLREHGVVPEAADVAVDTLGGGVSNVVLRVRYDGDALVVKQPLENLAVEDDWPADVTRVHNEAAAARTYRRVLRDARIERVTVPSVEFESRDDHVIAISSAPADARTWKAELLDRRIDEAVAVLAGQCLGTVHGETAADEDVRETFGRREPFEQLRLEPYHRTVAGRHPEVEGEIRAEIERLRTSRATLVHGDFSPKNVLVDRSGSRPTIWVLDFEVAHWGDPAFDVAFMLNHLYIKSVFERPHSTPYLDAASAFWRTYDERVDWSIESETVRELGILMLARVDGKSPVEYVETETTAEILRQTAKRTLTTNATTIGEFEDLLFEELANAGDDHR